MRVLPWAMVGLALLAAGCGGRKTVHLTGEVTFDGKQVPIGEIYFDPDAKKGQDGPQGFARIIDGKFDTRKGGVPPGPGPHVVRILGFDGKPQPDRELIYGPRLFPEYSTTADVPARDGTLDFQVPTRPAR